MPPLHIRSNGKLAAPEGTHAGLNQPVRGLDAGGREFVFKSNGIQGFGEAIAVRELDIKEIVLSHLLCEKLRLVGLPYQDALLDDTRPGICTPYLPGLQTLETKSIDDIINPDEAVAASVAMGWFADDDCRNHTNVWILADGTALPAVDFGLCLSVGVEMDDRVKVNDAILKAYARPHNVEPTLERIRILSDEELYETVDDLGRRHVGEWNPEMLLAIAAPLVYNRNELRRGNPFRRYYLTA